MLKNFLFFICLILFAGCSAPGTAFLGPVFTGAKTGSISQASLSYSSGQIFEQFQLKEALLKEKKNLKKNVKKNPILPDIPYVTDDPIIVLAYKVDKIDETQVYEPEPLP